MIYHEEGGQFLVEVLTDDTSADGMHVLNLRCLDVLVDSSSFPGMLTVGEDFEVSAQSGFENVCGWRLEEVEAQA